MVREYLINKSGSGLYRNRDFREACEAVGVNYNTVRSQFEFFEFYGLLVRNKQKGFIKIVELTGKIGRLYKLFKTHRKAICASSNPKVYFADLWKARLIKTNIVSQAYREAGKCKDSNNGKKLLKIVRGSRTPLGKKQGINLSLMTIGKVLGRTKGTAHRTIARMAREGIMNVEKRSLFVCEASEFDRHKRTENLYGRLFIREGKVFERLQNSYAFLV